MSFLDGLAGRARGLVVLGFLPAEAIREESVELKTEFEALAWASVLLDGSLGRGTLYKEDLDAISQIALRLKLEKHLVKMILDDFASCRVAWVKLWWCSTNSAQILSLLIFGAIWLPLLLLYLLQ